MSSNPIYRVSDDDDLSVTMRILDVLKWAQETGCPEGGWDNAVEHILNGDGFEKNGVV